MKSPEPEGFFLGAAKCGPCRCLAGSALGAILTPQTTRRYMKYLYPYECEKRGLSNPNELQAAIDSNRREGRRQGFGGSLFAYSPGGAHGLLSSPKLPSLGLAANTNGSSITPAPKIKKGEGLQGARDLVPAWHGSMQTCCQYPASVRHHQSITLSQRHTQDRQ